MRNAVKASLWAIVALLFLSLALTLIGGAMNLEAALRTGTVTWWLSCAAFFLWAVTRAYVSFGKFGRRGERRGR